MPERINELKRVWNLPSVRMSAPELLAILENISLKDGKITVLINGYEFADLADIRKNLHLFIGEPTIKIGNSTLLLRSDFGSKFENYSWKSASEYNLIDIEVKRLELELGQYRPIAFSYIGRALFSTIVGGIMGIIFAEALMEDLSVTNKAVFIIFFVILAFGFQTILFTILVKLVPIGSVYYKNSKTHFSKHSRQITVGVIITVIGTIIAAAILSFF